MYSNVSRFRSYEWSSLRLPTLKYETHPKIEFYAVREEFVLANEQESAAAPAEFI